MPVPLTTDVRNAAAAREKASAWFFELFTDEGTLRAWDQNETITFDGQTFEPIGTTGRIEGEIRSSSNLVAEPLMIVLDGGKQSDDASFVGRLLDRSWHRREIRVRQVLFNVSTNFVTTIGAAFDWLGHMDTIQAPLGVNAEASVILTCYSGTFLARARTLRTVSDVDQKMRDPTDASFKNIAVKPRQDIPFGTAWTTVPGVQTGSDGQTGGGNRFNSSDGSGNTR
jgi:hypothetical protein